MVTREECTFPIFATDFGFLQNALFFFLVAQGYAALRACAVGAARNQTVS
jgi:hypothetical protein